MFISYLSFLAGVGLIHYLSNDNYSPEIKLMLDRLKLIGFNLEETKIKYKADNNKITYSIKLPEKFKDFTTYSLYKRADELKELYEVKDCNIKMEGNKLIITLEYYQNNTLKTIYEVFKKNNLELGDYKGYAVIDKIQTNYKFMIPKGFSPEKYKAKEKELGIQLQSIIEVDYNDNELILKRFKAKIPNDENNIVYYDYNRYLAQLKKYDFPILIGDSRKGVQIIDFAQDPNLLIGGESRSGKSALLRVILGTLIQLFSPKELQLILCDLKNGVEVADFEEAPQIKNSWAKDTTIFNCEFAEWYIKENPLILEVEEYKITKKTDKAILFNNNFWCPKAAAKIKSEPSKDYQDGIIDNREDILEMLNWAIAEVKARNSKFKKMGVKKIWDYNKKAKDKIPVTLITFDEFSDFADTKIKEIKDLNNEIKYKLQILASKGASTGIFIIVSTQKPLVDVVGSITRENLASRIGFRMSTKAGSKTILDNDLASLLPNIKGRCIVRNGVNNTETQVSWLSEDELEKIIKKLPYKEQKRDNKRIKQVNRSNAITKELKPATKENKQELSQNNKFKGVLFDVN